MKPLLAPTIIMDAEREPSLDSVSVSGLKSSTTATSIPTERFSTYNSSETIKEIFSSNKIFSDPFPSTSRVKVPSLISVTSRSTCAVWMNAGIK